MKTVYDVQRLYRRPAMGKVSGVCYGIAQHFGWPSWAVRLAALVFLFSFTVPALVAYFTAVLLLPSR